jgi:hypothetical protein
LKNYSKKVNLLPINPDKLTFEKVPDKELYYMELPLDAAPDDIWGHLFEAEYRSDLNKMWRAEVTGSVVRVITATDSVKRQIEWTKNLVARVNAAVDRHNEAVKEENQVEAQGMQREKDEIEKMRKSLKE